MLFVTKQEISGVISVGATERFHYRTCTASRLQYAIAFTAPTREQDLCCGEKVLLFTPEKEVMQETPEREQDHLRREGL